MTKEEQRLFDWLLSLPWPSDGGLVQSLATVQPIDKRISKVFHESYLNNDWPTIRIRSNKNVSH